MSEPLTMLYNQSLRKSKVPSMWRSALISAIFKKCQAGNYKPVSLTSVACKVLENLVREHIIELMKRNNFFTKKQYGFISERSTALQLLKVLDKWTDALHLGYSIDCVYMDYQKAFDTVPHKRLHSKLTSYGINEQLIAWIDSSISNRVQQVGVNGERSAWHKVPSGIPQDSVLGPLLFVIFINELPETVNSDAYLFADDTHQNI